MIKIYDLEFRNINEQVQKNKDDIEELKAQYTPYLVEGENITIVYSEDYKQATISASLSTAIDSEMSTTSTNPLQNKVITEIVGDIRRNIDSLDSRIETSEEAINSLNNDKQDKLTQGANITITNNTISATDTNTFPIPIYNTGLKISNSNDGNNNHNIFVPYATNNNAGVIDTNTLRQTILEQIQVILPQIAPLFFPQAGEIIETINLNYNPNNAFQGTYWRKFKSGLYLVSGVGGVHNDDEVPNVMGTWAGAAARSMRDIKGVFTGTHSISGAASWGGSGGSDHITKTYFDASKGQVNADGTTYKPQNESAYKNGGRVRPESIAVYRWIRVDGLTTEELNLINPYLEEETTTL